MEHWNGSFRYFLFKQPVPTQQQQQEKKGPIVLFHGGGGLVAYSSFVRGLKSLGRDVVCIEMSYVSLHVAPNVPTIDEHVSTYRSIMEKNGYAGKKSVLIGHSYGTNVVTWLVKALGDAHVETAVFLVVLQRTIPRGPAGFACIERGVAFQLGQDGAVRSQLPAAGSGLAPQRPLRRGAVEGRHQQLGCPEQQRHDHITPCVSVKDHFAALESECQREGNDMVVQLHTLEGANHGQLVITERYRLETIRLIKAALLKCLQGLS